MSVENCDCSFARSNSTVFDYSSFFFFFVQSHTWKRTCFAGTIYVQWFGAISHDKVFEHCSSNWFPLLTHTPNTVTTESHLLSSLPVLMFIWVRFQFFTMCFSLARGNQHLQPVKFQRSKKRNQFLTSEIPLQLRLPSRTDLESPGRIRSLRQNESINNITDKTDDNKRRQTAAGGASVTRQLSVASRGNVEAFLWVGKCNLQ